MILHSDFALAIYFIPQIFAQHLRNIQSGYFVKPISRYIFLRHFFSNNAELIREFNVVQNIGSFDLFAAEHSSGLASKFMTHSDGIDIRSSNVMQRNRLMVLFFIC